MERDTLEDYLVLSEQILKDTNKVKGVLTTDQKRKESERKALRIVELCLERSVHPEIFLKSIVYLNPSYYEDITKERALLLVCGYPLCKKKISKPKNQFKICNKAKKVYDLNEYGSFCSIFCFNASNHIKSQIPDSPLWLRDLEDIHTVSLLVKKEASRATSIDIKSEKTKKNQEFNPISSFAKLSLDDIGDINASISVIKEKQVESSLQKTRKTKLLTVMESDEEIASNENGEKKSSKNNSKCLEVRKQCTEDTNDRTAIKNLEKLEELNNELSYLRLTESNNHKKNSRSSCEKTEKNHSTKVQKSKDIKTISDKIKRRNLKPKIQIIDPLPLKCKTNEASTLYENKHESQNEYRKNKSLLELKFSFKESASTIQSNIWNIFKSWITLETLMFIHGEDIIKKSLHVNKLSEHFERLKISQLETDQQHKYLTICRKLCQDEIVEEQIDGLLVKNKLSLIPDYRQLKKESKEFDIKVSTFYSGELHETDDKNFGTVREKQTEDLNTESDFDPLNDVNSQNALRQQILLGTLRNSIQCLLDYIKYDSSLVLTELNGLVNTFKLNAENIVFKLTVRNYLGLICLKILSLKDSKLGKALEQIEFIELETSVFQQLPGDKEVLMNSLKMINDVDNFVETYVKS